MSSNSYAVNETELRQSLEKAKISDWKIQAQISDFSPINSMIVSVF